MRLLLTTTLLLFSLPTWAAPETKSITIDKPVKITVEFPKDFAVKEGQFGGLEIHARKTDDNDAPAMMLLSVSIDLGPDATEKRVIRFLRGGQKEAKIISQGKVRYVLTADDSNKVPKNSFIKSSYRTALDGVIFSLSTAVVNGRESEPQAIAIMKAVPAILASVKRVK